MAEYLCFFLILYLKFFHSLPHFFLDALQRHSKGDAVKGMLPANSLSQQSPAADQNDLALLEKILKRFYSIFHILRAGRDSDIHRFRLISQRTV